MRVHVFLLFVCLLGSSAAQSNTTTSETTDSTSSRQTTTAPSSTAEPQTTRKTTEATIPTTKATTPTTETTEKTTPTPTVAPTTTKATTPTAETTEKTTPTPTVAPTTTVGPVTTVAPEPDSGDWQVSENNVVCIRAKMAVKIVSDLNGNVVTHNLSPNATKIGSRCSSPDNKTQLLALQDEGYTLDFIFAEDKTKTYVQNITVGFSSEEREISGSYFSVVTGKSYKCNAVNKVTMENVTVQFTNMQLQAFGTTNKTDFFEAEDCDDDDRMGNTVPIAVGCALAAMVLIILIGYFVTRRRAKQQGYQSM